MSGRALLLIITGIILISGNIFLQLTERGKDISANVDRSYLREASINIAESGVGIGMRKVVDEPTWRTGIPIMDLLGGKASISVADTTYLGRPAVMVACVGIMQYGRPTEYRDTSIAFMYGDTIPGVIQGTITTTHNVDQDSTFTVDGRDHDKDGTLCGHTGCGKKAVWTEGNCSSHDGSRVEGSDDEDHDDHDFTSDTNIVKEHQPPPTCGVPHSPDSVMNTCGTRIPDGTLKSAAVSCIHGSQYTTDPTTLTYPLKGVTYVELPAGGTWNSANVTGSGVLVVHNSANNACIKNVTTGPFSGIVIADEVDHVNCTIVGAVLSTGCQQDSVAKGCGSVVFSRTAVKESTGEVLRSIVTNGSRNSAIAWKQ